MPGKEPGIILRQGPGQRLQAVLCGLPNVCSEHTSTYASSIQPYAPSIHATKKQAKAARWNVCSEHTLVPTQDWRRKAPKVPERARRAREGRAPAGTCVGCEQPTSAGSGLDPRALRIFVGRNCRCRKGFEPSWRVSETAGPQSASAFRIACRAAEVTGRRP